MNPAAAAVRKIRNLGDRLWRSVISNSSSLSSSSPIWNRHLTSQTATTRVQLLNSPRLGVLSTPWSATQLRPKFCGSDVRPGNVIERKGRKYQVVKALHRTPGKGGALIQVELRDVDSGNKVNERLRTDEVIERVYVEQRTYTYLFTDEESESVVLMEPKTYDQMEVPKTLFGESIAYLKDNMSVTVELYDEKPMSASVPQRVTCTVVETQLPVKGIGATPHNKKALLDNGLTIQVPAHILTGDQLLIDTTDNSYMSSSFNRMDGTIFLDYRT